MVANGKYEIHDARNMLRQKLIINIWLLHLVGFLSLQTLLTMHGHRNLKLMKYMSVTGISDCRRR